MVGLEQLSTRKAPEGYPRYGYMLDSGGRVIGVVLLIFATARNGGVTSVRCNISSWYVEPAFRSYASLLVSHALKHPVTYLNVSPASHTWPIIEAQGFRRFCDGVFAAVPVADLRPRKAKVIRVGGRMRAAPPIPPEEFELLSAHDGFGCISLWCETPEGGHPFVFRRRHIKDLKLLPCAQLIYSAGIDDLARVSGPVGRFLALRGMPFILVPANGAIPHLVGKYYQDKPMYYRGPVRPRPGDLAYTETALFGG